MCMRLSPTPKIYMVKKEVPSSIILSWTSFFFRQSSRVEVVGVKVVVVVV